jgi:hypothetical protein
MGPNDDKIPAMVWQTGHQLGDLTAGDIDNYVAIQGKGRWTRVSTANMVSALRAFLRYAAKEGGCSSRLAESIARPRLYQRMPGERLSMRKIREVLRLRFAHRLSQRAIGQSLRLSAGAVNGCLSRARRAGLGWPLPDELDDAQLETLLYPPPSAARRCGACANSARSARCGGRGAQSRGAHASRQVTEAPLSDHSARP